jgi:hypothetical protein
MSSITNWRIEYRTLVKQLPIAALYKEVQRLEASVKHLRQSNDDLKTYHESGQEENSAWVFDIVNENNLIILKQTEQTEISKERILEIEQCAQTQSSKEERTTPEVVSNGHTKTNEVNESGDGQDSEDHMDVDGTNTGIHL